MSERWMKVPRFGDNAKSSKMESDPVRPTDIDLSIHDIKVYDYNPRRAPNDKLVDIENLIRQRGFENTLNVTRRPGDKHYMPVQGGNTTLFCISRCCN